MWLLSDASVTDLREYEHRSFPQSRGGTDEEENLWLTCSFCNNAKSDHVQGYDALTENFVPLFNPRKHIWSEHFTWKADDKAFIIGLTPCGRATIQVLKINEGQALRFRRLMVSADWYP